MGPAPRQVLRTSQRGSSGPGGGVVISIYGSDASQLRFAASSSLRSLRLEIHDRLGYGEEACVE